MRTLTNAQYTIPTALSESIAAGGFGRATTVKTLPFDDTIGTVPLFTVTGDVLVRLAAICQTGVVSAAGCNGIVGVASNTNFFIASTDMTLLAASDIWHDASPDSDVEALSVIADAILASGADINLVLDAQCDSGVLAFYAIWTPLSAGATVVAAYRRGPMAQLTEAATLRNKILAAWRDMLLVLADRTIPDSVRKELEDVRLIFRQTWADLEASAQDEAKAAESAVYVHRGLLAQVLSEAGDIGDLGKHLASKYGMAHLFSDCMKDEATQSYDAETRAAVCARAHYEAVGKWPSQKESQEGEVNDKDKKLAEQVPGDQGTAPPPAAGEMPPPQEQTKPEQEILDAFIKAFDPGKRKYAYWVSAVSTDPQSPFGAAVLVQKEETGDVFAVTFLKGADGKYAFSGEDEWVPVEVEYRKPGTDVATEPQGPDEMPSEPTAPLPEPAAAAAPAPMAQGAEQQAMNLAESVTGIESLSEGGVPNDGQGPLTMRVKLIEPGWGNPKDNHYYSKEVLARDAHVFNGTMMFESDHKNDKSTHNWVSTVRKVVGFSSTGAPIAEVVVHDPGFAQRVRNLKAEGLLEHLPCSILATGQVKPGKIEDRDASIVEAITAAESVDWVTRAGAGGKALELAEAASKPLDAATVQAHLAELPLHTQVKERLIGREYHTLQEIDDAAKAEVSYVKRVTGSGAAVGLGESGAPQGGRTLEEHEKALDELDKQYGLKR